MQQVILILISSRLIQVNLLKMDLYIAINWLVMNRIEGIGAAPRVNRGDRLDVWKRQSAAFDTCHGLESCVFHRFARLVKIYA